MLHYGDEGEPPSAGAPAHGSTLAEMLRKLEAVAAALGPAAYEDPELPAALKDLTDACEVSRQSALAEARGSAGSADGNGGKMGPQQGSTFGNQGGGGMGDGVAGARRGGAFGMPGGGSVAAGEAGAGGGGAFGVQGGGSGDVGGRGVGAFGVGGDAGEDVESL